MIFAILTIIKFARGKNSSIRLGYSEDKSRTMLIELWYDQRRHGWVTLHGMALNERPKIADEAMNPEHLVAFNPVERVVVYLLMRHYLKKDVRNKMRAIALNIK